MSTRSGQVAGHVARRPLLITAAALALAGILTGCEVNQSTAPITTPEPATVGAGTAGRAVPAVAPTPAPVAATANPWTPALCDWALSYLASDARLDRAAAAGPRDPRFPGQTAASWTAYYTGLADQWDATGQLIAAKCGRASAPATVDCATAINWLAPAAVAHEQDLQRAGVTAADATWDRAWSTFYRTLAADLGVGC